MRLALLPRAFTLVELLVALGIILLMLAIALPFTMRVLEERELASTEESIASELIRARVHAQESGLPVEVVVREGAPSSITIRYFDVAPREKSSRSQRASTPRRSDGQRSSGARRDASWSEVSEISSSIRVAAADTTSASAAESAPSDRTLRAPTTDSVDALDEPSSDRAGESMLNQLGTDSDDAPVRVAVFLPDGSILFAATLLLVHESGLSSRLTVDPWTGHAAVERGAGPGAANGERSAPRAADAPSGRSTGADPASPGAREPSGTGDAATEAWDALDGWPSEFEDREG